MIFIIQILHTNHFLIASYAVRNALTALIFWAIHFAKPRGLELLFLLILNLFNLGDSNSAHAPMKASQRILDIRL